MEPVELLKFVHHLRREIDRDYMMLEKEIMGRFGITLEDIEEEEDATE